MRPGGPASLGSAATKDRACSTTRISPKFANGKRRRREAWRELAQELESDLEGLGPEETLEARDVLEKLAAKARSLALERAVLQFVGDNPGAASNAVVQHVAGDRTHVLRVLRELGRAGALRFEPGPKGARLWYAGKTSLDYQPMAGWS